VQGNYDEAKDNYNQAIKEDELAGSPVDNTHLRVDWYKNRS
jgi:hypothetical protein